MKTININKCHPENNCKHYQIEIIDIDDNDIIANEMIHLNDLYNDNLPLNLEKYKEKIKDKFKEINIL